MSRSYPGMAVSTKPRVVGVSCLKRATRVRSIVSTEICAPIVASRPALARRAAPRFEDSRVRAVASQRLVKTFQRAEDLTGALFCQILRRSDRLGWDSDQIWWTGVDERTCVDGAALRVLYPTNMEADTSMTHDRGPCVGMGWRRWLVLLGALCVLAAPGHGHGKDKDQDQCPDSQASVSPSFHVEALNVQEHGDLHTS